MTDISIIDRSLFYSLSALLYLSMAKNRENGFLSVHPIISRPYLTTF